MCKKSNSRADKTATHNQHGGSAFHCHYVTMLHFALVSDSVLVVLFDLFVYVYLLNSKDYLISILLSFLQNIISYIIINTQLCSNKFNSEEDYQTNPGPRLTPTPICSIPTQVLPLSSKLSTPPSHLPKLASSKASASGFNSFPGSRKIVWAAT